MANEKVVLRRGPSSSIPSTKVPGTILIETDTGRAYVDDTESSRIQIKDDTKLPIDGTAKKAESDSNGNSLTDRITTLDTNESTGVVTLKNEKGETKGTVVNSSYVDTALSDKMDKVNPTGTGSFSLNRKAGTPIGEWSFAEGSETTASGGASHAEGYDTTASGNYSHSEGTSTTASGMASHAEGAFTTASGSSSHAEGESTIASGNYSHAEGKLTTASGNYSHAEGNSSDLFSSIVTTTNPTNDDIITAWNSNKFSLAKGDSAHVEGTNNLALGNYSHAEGDTTIASGDISHAEGDSTTSSGSASHAEGYNTTAENEGAHAEGGHTTASGQDSHAEGIGSTASGDYSHAEGDGTNASGTGSHAEGFDADASGNYSHAEGSSAVASGNSSHAEGISTTALGDSSHAEGRDTIAGQMGFKVTACEKLTDTTGTYTLTSVTGLAINQRYSVHLSSVKEDCGYITAIDTENKKITVNGYPDIALISSSSPTANHLTIVDQPLKGDIKVDGDDSHAEGSSTKALGKYSHAEGDNTTASGDYGSHAEGHFTTASGDRSHAEGGATIASGNHSHAEGECTEALGYDSHAEGGYTTASGSYSHAEGQGTIASSDDQHVQGAYNIEDSSTTYVDIIGNGTGDSVRSNAATVDWSGNAWYAGDVYVGSTSGTNKDSGSKKLATEEYVNSAVISGGSNIVIDDGSID